MKKSNKNICCYCLPELSSVSDFYNLIVIFLLIVFLFLSACKEQIPLIESDNLNKKTDIQMSDTEAYFYIENNIIDFGTIHKKKQNTVFVNFEFVNTGKSSLIVIKANPSCGCMLANIPEKPIEKGEKGIIEVKINLKNEKGGFNKNVILKTNAENEHILLRIKGYVK